MRSGLNFGTRLIATETREDFIKFCEERDYSIDQMKNELERSKETIIEESNHLSVYYIEDHIASLEKCPSCDGGFFTTDEGIRYCPVCD